MMLGGIAAEFLDVETLIGKQKGRLERGDRRASLEHLRPAYMGPMGFSRIRDGHNAKALPTYFNSVKH